MTKAHALMAQAKPHTGCKLSNINGNTIPPIDPPAKLLMLTAQVRSSFCVLFVVNSLQMTYRSMSAPTPTLAV